MRAAAGQMRALALDYINKITLSKKFVLSHNWIDEKAHTLYVWDSSEKYIIGELGKKS